MTRKSSTSDDLEGSLHSAILIIRLSELTTEIRKKINPYLSAEQQKCSPRIPLSGGIRLTRMFV